MEFISHIIPDLIISTGTGFFVVWLLRTFLGKNTLIDSLPRRNDIPIYLPFVMLFFSLQLVPLTGHIILNIAGDLPEWKGIFLYNLIYAIGEIISIIIILVLAWFHFPRRLKGFGLNIRTAFKDFYTAVLNLFTVRPVIIATILVTVYIGQYFSKGQYNMQQHEQLKVITENRQLPLQILVSFIAIFIAPLVEELLFRGLFQTWIRSLLESFTQIRYAAWVAIIMSSVLFVSAHADTDHWPALLVLAVCLGYSYEKSGSLLRPIFIHAIFNAISIISTLNQ